MISVLVGLQAGDESKGHATGHVMRSADICCRFSGSCNTGATVVTETGQKFKFHHLPVGIAVNKPSYIGSACLIDPRRLADEIAQYKAFGFDVDTNLRISPDAHIISPEHIERDTENENSGKGVGSTKRGVAFCASDKALRVGRTIDSLPEFDRYISDVPYELNVAADNGKHIVFEGSQGFELDVDQGNYPFVSSTNNVSGAICSSCGIAPNRVDRVVGVLKSYSTYVGTGPYITEIHDEALNSLIVDRGHEYGTSTGRRRRVGYINIPMLKRACMVNGCTELFLSKSDVLIGLKGVKYCVAYDIDGALTDRVPLKRADYWRAKPIYEQVDVRTGREFIAIIEEATKIPVKYFSFGARSDQIQEL
jgi:adenylosuccinate synthase